MFRRVPFSFAVTTLACLWSTVAMAQVPVAVPPDGAAASANSHPSAPADAEVEVDSASAAPSSPTDATTTVRDNPTLAVASGQALALPAAAQSVAPTPPTAVTPPPTTSVAGAEPARAQPLVEISGYAQLQYESHADSSDQLGQGGTLLNQDRFLVRRLRLEISRRYDFASYLVELDGNTTSGPAFGLLRAEGSLYYTTKPGAPSLIEITAGLLKNPFGYETPESPRLRWFMERTTASRAFFPSEVDVGARLHGGWNFLRYSVALMNGEPKGTRANNFQLQDPNHAKDVIVRMGADVPMGDSFAMSGGISYLAGKGFHAGDDATKSRILWTDANENGMIDSGELSGAAGTATVPSENFRRWAVALDFQTRLRSCLGWTALTAEAVAAVNLDRGLFIANPTQASPDAREFGWHVGVTQEITKYAVVGFRYDTYNPDSDLLDSRGGIFLPNSQTISTYSPLVGLTLPERARLVFQYDFVRDGLARDNSGVPTDLSNNQWTLRFQVKL